MTIVDVIEGPLWQISVWTFVILAVWRMAVIALAGRFPARARSAGSASAGAAASVVRRMAPPRIVRNSGRTWFVTLAGYAFHFGLFAVILFAAPHVAFIKEQLIGFGWSSLPRWGFIVAAELAFAGLMVLWIRRFADPVVRLISRPDDHIAAGLTFLVMLTGCMALGEQSTFLRVTHLLTVEVWLIYFPFSSLMHTFTWPLSRGLTGAVAGRRGTRF